MRAWCWTIHILCVNNVEFGLQGVLCTKPPKTKQIVVTNDTQSCWVNNSVAHVLHMLHYCMHREIVHMWLQVSKLPTFVKCCSSGSEYPVHFLITKKKIIHIFMHTLPLSCCFVLFFFPVLSSSVAIRIVVWKWKKANRFAFTSGALWHSL